MKAQSQVSPHRTHMIPFTVSLFLCISLIVSQPSIAYCKGTHKNYLLDQALGTIAMDRKNLGIRPDLSMNPFALSLFNRWMATPLKAPIEAQQKAIRLLHMAKEPLLCFEEFAKFGDIYSFNPLPLLSYQDHELPPGLPRPLKEAVHRLLDAQYTVNKKLTTIKKNISPEGKKLIEKYLYPDSYAHKDTKTQEEPFRIKALKQAIDAARMFDIKGIFEAGLTIMRALDEAKRLLTETDRWYKKIASFSFTTPLGLVRIGGTGSDVHENDAALIIDLGGNDLYKGQVASGKNGKCAIVIDLSGDDVYLGEDFTQGAGFWGIGILLDIKGNDLYRAGHSSQGSGLFGIGLLIDESGHDSYMGGMFVQAAASWGWGGLIDLAGEDSYLCLHYGQAYSEVRGIACLLDLKGNDKYISGAKAPDPREPDMNQSFSQGFAMGMRNVAAGGFALLADKSGNDIYQCQYFGQGSSYWMGIGILYDENGKDTYMARRYAQGAGIHFSFGLLLDVAGNDNMISWGVSQGCGHDYGVGILINETGDDTYIANWLSMGASEANGVGVFVDNFGNDGYETNSGMAVGRLIEARRSGGIGLFMDANGKDSYSKNGSENSVWGFNRWGIGIDKEEGGISGLNLLPHDPPFTLNEEAERKKIEEKRRLSKILNRSDEMSFPDNVESLLSLASHWGFERQIPKEAEEKLYCMKPDQSVPAIANFLDTPDIMSLIFMEKFFAIYAFHAIPELLKKTAISDPLIRSRAFYYLGKLKDSRALKNCLEALRDPSWRVQSSAARAIGEILNKKRLDLLVPMRVALNEALKENESGILKDYLKDGEKMRMVLSVIARAIPLDYQTYKKYVETYQVNTPTLPSPLKGEDLGVGGGEKRKLLNDFSSLIFDNMDKIIPLLTEWILAINESDNTAKKLMPYLNDKDPSVKSAAAYSLGQMNYRPAIPPLVSLLKDANLWVRDAAVLALALFKEEVLSPLSAAMKQEDASFRILALDLLARIGTDRSKALMNKYLNDPDENVRRAARAGLKLFHSF